MASQRESLPREAERLKGKIRQLINNDLKEICRSEHLAVSGVKAVLQQRVIARTLHPITSRLGQLRIDS
jgi:E3 SUMO-protein ligase PIAS1